MSSETTEEIEARGFFECLGYVVARIPEARDSQRADYSIEDGTDRYSVGGLSIVPRDFTPSRTIPP
jgi:hypothetical protein